MQIIDPKANRPCHPKLHDWVPIIEAEMTVGLVCTTCGKSVREGLDHPAFIVNEDGVLEPQINFESGGYLNPPARPRRDL